VEVAGIEPASFNTKPGLLRVQPARRSTRPRRSRRQVADRPSHCAMSRTAPWPSRPVSLLPMSVPGRRRSRT